LPTLCLPARSAEYWLAHPVNPAELYAQMAGNPNLEENATGEPFAWHSSGGGTFVTGYRIRWTFIDGYRDYEVRVVPPVSGISQ